MAQYMDDQRFRQLLDRLGLSWRGYARVRKGVKKRIARHMQELGLDTMEDYLHTLHNPGILTAAERLLTVSISHFFRDRYLWQALEEEILPDIIKEHSEKIDVWSAGCALGQEVYSFAILWHMLKGRFGRLPRLYLLATDSNPDYLEKAGKGVFSRSSLKGLSDEMIAAYFHATADKSHYVAAGYLKKDIVWQVHDLIREPPPAGRFQIIFLRNSLLTYYTGEKRMPVFRKVIDSLDDGGFVITGSHEKLPFQTPALAAFKTCSFIFRKI